MGILFNLLLVVISSLFFLTGKHNFLSSFVHSIYIQRFSIFTYSPVVVAFSCRGSIVVTRQVLKPYVIGPGVNILAGWSEAVEPSGLELDSTISCNILAGWLDAVEPTGLELDNTISCQV